MRWVLVSVVTPVSTTDRGGERDKHGAFLARMHGLALVQNVTWLPFVGGYMVSASGSFKIDRGTCIILWRGSNLPMG